MAAVARPLRLFEGFGVELEYMLVHTRTLNVMTAADELLRKAASADDYVSDVPLGEITASNEITSHLIELKTTEPARSFAGLAEAFQTRIRRLNGLLAPLGGQLLPTAMHPWMDPLNETKIWQHEYSQVYTLLNRIFNCQGHGWSNVQSVHLNLPFEGDEEFARLHAAVRLILPIIPALAAASPILEGRDTGLLDTRLEMYRTNARRIPSITGRLIPETVRTEAEYRDKILEPMYADVAPYDKQGILRHEWLNGRGAIARFERRTIEIRVLDVQECPRADLAILAAIVGVAQRLVSERWTPLVEQQRWEAARLEPILDAVTRSGDAARIDDLDYLRQFGIDRGESTSAGGLWGHLTEELLRASPDEHAQHADVWRVLCEQGPLARRILRAWDVHRSHVRLVEIYRTLGDCLAEGRLFETAAAAG